MLTQAELDGPIKHHFSNEDRLYHFIYRSRQVHGDKYDYSSTVYTKAREKLSIICPVHGTFQIRADNHKQGKGCPNCGNHAHDIFYFWKLGDTSVYKYGITTSSRKYSRIYEVAHQHSVTPHIIKYLVLLDAYKLERLVKTSFRHYRASIEGPGHTEMLELDAKAFREVSQFIDQNYKLLLTFTKE